MLNQDDYGVLGFEICYKETTKTQKVVNAFEQFTAECDSLMVSFNKESIQVERK